MALKRKVPVSVALDIEQNAALRRLAAATGETYSALVREALAAYLERRRAEIPSPEPDPRQLRLGSVEDGDPPSQ